MVIVGRFVAPSDEQSRRGLVTLQDVLEVECSCLGPMVFLVPGYPALQAGVSEYSTAKQNMNK